MRMIRINMALSVLIALIAFGFNSYAQPNIPKENIPSNLSAEVRAEVEGLYAPEAAKRVQAAIKLGTMGDKAIPAIPFLIGMLGDTAGVGLKAELNLKLSTALLPALKQLWL